MDYAIIFLVYKANGGLNHMRKALLLFIASYMVAFSVQAQSLGRPTQPGGGISPQPVFTQNPLRILGNPADNCYNVGHFVSLDTANLFTIPVDGGNCNGFEIAKTTVYVALLRIDPAQDGVQILRPDTLTGIIAPGKIVTIPIKSGGVYAVTATTKAPNLLSADIAAHEQYGIIDFTGKLSGKPEFLRVPSVHPVDYPFVTPIQFGNDGNPTRFSFSFSGEFAGMTTGSIYYFDSDGNRVNLSKVTFNQGRGDNFVAYSDKDPRTLGVLFGTFVDEQGLSSTSEVFKPRQIQGGN